VLFNVSYAVCRVRLQIRGRGVRLFSAASFHATGVAFVLFTAATRPTTTAVTSTLGRAATLATTLGAFSLLTFALWSARTADHSTLACTAVGRAVLHTLTRSTLARWAARAARYSTMCNSRILSLHWCHAVFTQLVNSLGKYLRSKFSRTLMSSNSKRVFTSLLQPRIRSLQTVFKLWYQQLSLYRAPFVSE